MVRGKKRGVVGYENPSVSRAAKTAAATTTSTSELAEGQGALRMPALPLRSALWHSRPSRCFPC